MAVGDDLGAIVRPSCVIFSDMAVVNKFVKGMKFRQADHFVYQY